MDIKRKNTKVEYYIRDWAGNHKFPEKVFVSFDDAWGFLMEKFPKDEDLGEFDAMERKA